MKFQYVALFFLFFFVLLGNVFSAEIARYWFEEVKQMIAETQGEKGAEVFA